MEKYMVSFPSPANQLEDLKANKIFWGGQKFPVIWREKIILDGDM